MIQVLSYGNKRYSVMKEWRAVQESLILELLIQGRSNGIQDSTSHHQEKQMKDRFEHLEKKELVARILELEKDLDLAEEEKQEMREQLDQAEQELDRRADGYYES